MDAHERAAIDAAFALMADDPDYLAECEALEREFAVASWEAFQLAEDVAGIATRPERG